MPTNIPNLVIAGVNKAGTTSLFSALSLHPDVATSDVKETCFFLPLRYGEEQPPTECYSDHFDTDAAVVMEATPGYFYGGSEIAPVLASLSSELRVVIVLREPVSRLLSFFRFQKSMLQLPASLTADDYVEHCLGHAPDDLAHRRELNPWFGVEGGHYDRYLPAWVEVFGGRLDVLFFDDLVADIDRVASALGARFGLDPQRWPAEASVRENRTIAPRRRLLHRAALSMNRTFERQLRRHPSVKARARQIYERVNTGEATDDLSAGTRDELERAYAPWNAALQQRLAPYGLALPPWTRTDPNVVSTSR